MRVRFTRTRATMVTFASWAACALLLTQGCGDGGASSGAEPAPARYDHGECAVLDGGEHCICDPGYTGNHCAECAAGFVASGADCLAGDGTEPPAIGPCTRRATGNGCEDCAVGYHRDGARCTRDEACTEFSCPGQASCDDSTGVIVCECDEGYTEPDCALCAAGYHDRGANCVANEVCQTDSCSSRGDCDDSQGVIRCACDPGFEGFDCSECAAGIHPAGDGCDDAAVRCAPDTCSNHGECSAAASRLTCACEEGYTGQRCADCEDNFSLVDGACLPLQQSTRCNATVCSLHGSCDDGSGTAVCTCDTGYRGLACQLCSTGRVRGSTGECQRSYCGDGIVYVPGGEDCDDSNAVTEDCAYTTSLASCTVCRSDCTLGAGVSNYCGDGNLDAGEVCDDGANNGLYRGDASMGYCKADCSGEGAYCGDGTLDQGNEECDLGQDPMTGNSDAVPDRCRTTCLSPSCGDGVTDQGEFCDDPLDVDCPADCATSCPFTLTHSVDTTTITPLNSVSCNSLQGHSDNRYLRIFDLDAFGILKFEVTQMRFGVETAIASMGSVPVTGRIYSSAESTPRFTQMTLVKEEAMAVTPTSSGVTVTLPIAATVAGPAGTFLAAELFTPNGETSGKTLYIGSNSGVENAPSYLLAADCGISEFLTMSSIGFPEMHILIHVDGFATGPVCDAP